MTCVAAAAVLPWPPADSFRTEDRNGDGRPDIWRVYDRHHRLAAVAIDTNFDGRSDVREYYDAGTLVSRESDRNFDDRVDLIQQFDQTTHDEVRAVEDVDYDGTADQLILFQDGRPTFSKWSHELTSVHAAGATALNAVDPPRSADDALASLDDPFRTDRAVRAIRIAAGFDGVALSTSAGLPALPRAPTVRLVVASALARTAGPQLLSDPLVPRPSRGPPVSRL